MVEGLCFDCGDFGVISVRSSGRTHEELYRYAAKIHPCRNLIRCSRKLRDMTMHSRIGYGPYRRHNVTLSFCMKLL